MNLKNKAYLVSISLHIFLFAFCWTILSEMGNKILFVGPILVISLGCFHWLIGKAMQPLEYITTFSTLLKEREFTIRFNRLNQPELNKLIVQFNLMLTRLHKERLKVGERRDVFQQLMSESPVGVLLLDFSNNITDLNQAAERLLKISKKQVLNKNMQELSVGNIAYLQSIDAGTSELITGGDGERLKIGHFCIHDRGFQRSFFTISEMTGDVIQAQKSAYEKLIRSMSHEVNNTIATTNSLLESCLSFQEQLNGDDRDDFRQAINIVINRSQRLNEFMQAYADVVKLPLPKVLEFDFSQLVKNLSILFFAECNNRKIEFDLNIDDNVPIVADAHLIEQALVNVIKNAIEAIDNEGVIEITLRNNKEVALLSIKDSGCGLSNDTKENLFTPFFTTKESGQGVGLMLVQEIINLHDFEFSIKNNTNGIGVIFEMQTSPSSFQ